MGSAKIGTTLRFDTEDRQRMDEGAKAAGVTLTDFILTAVNSMLGRNECPRCHWKPGEPLDQTKASHGLSGEESHDAITVTGEEAKVVAVWRLMPEGWQRRVMGIMEEAAASDPLTPEGKDAAPPKRGSRRQGNQ